MQVLISRPSNLNEAMTAALATDEVRFQSYKSQQIPRKGYAPVQGLHQMKYKRRPSFQRNNPYPKHP